MQNTYPNIVFQLCHWQSRLKLDRRVQAIAKRAEVFPDGELEAGGEGAHTLAFTLVVKTVIANHFQVGEAVG